VEGNAYSLRQALFSLAPSWLPAQRCPGPGIGVQTTVALTPSTAPDSAALEWLDEVTMSRQQAQELLQGNCEALAFAGFARALWFSESTQGWLVGDLRYDREPELGFAEMEVAAAPQQCPRFIPPWVPPRRDLLGLAP
jgi:inner membrane protein